MMINMRNKHQCVILDFIDSSVFIVPYPIDSSVFIVPYPIFERYSLI